MPLKEEIMQKIRKKEIKMKPCCFFYVRKVGLQSLLALAIVSGAILLNVLLYFLKKTKAVDFLFFGWTGLEKFLLSLPYDYISLFLISLFLANYIIRKFDLSYGISMNSNMALIFLLAIVGILSLFFFISGIEDVLKFWAKDRPL